MASSTNIYSTAKSQPESQTQQSGFTSVPVIDSNGNHLPVTVNGASTNDYNAANDYRKNDRLSIAVPFSDVLVPFDVNGSPDSKLQRLDRAVEHTSDTISPYVLGASVPDIDQHEAEGNPDFYNFVAYMAGKGHSLPYSEYVKKTPVYNTIKGITASDFDTDTPEQNSLMALDLKGYQEANQEYLRNAYKEARDEYDYYLKRRRYLVTNPPYFAGIFGHALADTIDNAHNSYQYHTLADDMYSTLNRSSSKKAKELREAHKSALEEIESRFASGAISQEEYDNLRASAIADFREKGRQIADTYNEARKEIDKQSAHNKNMEWVAALYGGANLANQLGHAGVQNIYNTVTRILNQFPLGEFNGKVYGYAPFAPPDLTFNQFVRFRGEGYSPDTLAHYGYRDGNLSADSALSNILLKLGLKSTGRYDYSHIRTPQDVEADVKLRQKLLSFLDFVGEAPLYGANDIALNPATYFPKLAPFMSKFSFTYPVHKLRYNPWYHTYIETNPKIPFNILNPYRYPAKLVDDIPFGHYMAFNYLNHGGSWIADRTFSPLFGSPTREKKALIDSGNEALLNSSGASASSVLKDYEKLRAYPYVVKDAINLSMCNPAYVYQYLPRGEYFDSEESLDNFLMALFQPYNSVSSTGTIPFPEADIGKEERRVLFNTLLAYLQSNGNLGTNFGFLPYSSNQIFKFYRDFLETTGSSSFAFSDAALPMLSGFIPKKGEEWLFDSGLGVPLYHGSNVPAPSPTHKPTSKDISATMSSMYKGFDPYKVEEELLGSRKSPVFFSAYSPTIEARYLDKDNQERNWLGLVPRGSDYEYRSSEINPSDEIPNRFSSWLFNAIFGGKDKIPPSLYHPLYK